MYRLYDSQLKFNESYILTFRLYGNVNYNYNYTSYLNIHNDMFEQIENTELLNEISINIYKQKNTIKIHDIVINISNEITNSHVFNFNSLNFIENNIFYNIKNLINNKCDTDIEQQLNNLIYLLNLV